MKLKFTLALAALSFTAFHAQADSRLWYQQPADEWMKAVPLGNGRLGAMVYGGIDEEKVALNEISMWSGQPDPENNNLCGREHLDEIRECFFPRRLGAGRPSYRQISYWQGPLLRHPPAAGRHGDGLQISFKPYFRLPPRATWTTPWPL